MKLSSLFLTAAAAALLIGSNVAAQATMQPIPNPPAKAKAHGKHLAKHHGKKADKPADDAAKPKK